MWAQARKRTHLRFTQHRALGRKVSNEFAVPLCRGHRLARPIAVAEMEPWWKNAGIDPTSTARALWVETRPLRTIPDTGDIDKVSSQASVGTDQNSKGDRLISKRGRIRKTNPIISVDPQ